MCFRRDTRLRKASCISICKVTNKIPIIEIFLHFLSQSRETNLRYSSKGRKGASLPKSHSPGSSCAKLYLAMPRSIGLKPEYSFT